jgi:hypothetical protein
MSQAENPNNTNLSRRAALAGLAGAAAALPASVAAIVPAVAAYPAASGTFDPAAAFARLEYAVETLRKSYIRDGWHGHGLDEMAAATALQYFRDGCPDDDDRWIATIKFIGEHGQSCDWILAGNPGGMICHGAAQSRRAAVCADTELLALGTRFRPMYDAWVEQKAAQHRDQFELENFVERRTGCRLADYIRPPNGEIAIEQRRLISVARGKAAAEFRAEHGDIDFDAFDALESAMNDIANDILMFDATGREGLAVQFAAMIFHSHEAIEPTVDYDGEPKDPMLWNFLDSLASFTGVTFPPYQTYVELLLAREA